MKRSNCIVTFLVFLFPLCLFAQVNITINTNNVHPISPYLYGKNNNLSDNPSSPLSTAAWTKIKDSGLTFLRENGGNNGTKYNWKEKLTSHPDWYNNVYAHDWDFAAQSLQDNYPNAQGMWCFQLIGKAAKTNTANFNDWSHNQSQWWEGVAQNLAGGGTFKSTGTKAMVDGDPDLYLEDWNAESTTGILNHWFDELSLDKDHITYWSMDNEAEIWSGTHDDIMPTQISAEEFMQLYFDVAKQARAKFPDIKLTGPVTANEWQWYNWSNGITADGKKYPWLEYFIKRIGEEQEASGVRLLDVLDIHFYPGSTNATEVAQYHRVFFDKNYSWPEANGVKNITGSWDNSQTKEYIFERCNEWLDKYLGEGHGVTLGLTETGLATNDPTINALFYASTLGEFMKHPEVELYAPWHWQPAMWEVLHLYSRYNKPIFVNATSSQEEFVSAYPTINANGDSMTVVLVNRAESGNKEVTLNFNGFALENGDFDLLKLSGFKATETFISHSKNAIQQSTVAKTGNTISVTLPPMSVVSLLLKGEEGGAVTSLLESQNQANFTIFPNPIDPTQSTWLDIKVNEQGRGSIDLLDLNGRLVKSIYKGEINASFSEKADLSGLSSGVFFVRCKVNGRTSMKKVVVL